MKKRKKKVDSVPPHVDVAKGQRDEEHLDLGRAGGEGEEQREDVVDALDGLVYV